MSSSGLLSVLGFQPAAGTDDRAGGRPPGGIAKPPVDPVLTPGWPNSPIRFPRISKRSKGRPDPLPASNRSSLELGLGARRDDAVLRASQRLQCPMSRVVPDGS